MTVPVFAAEPVLLHAAGSLRSALTEVASAYEAARGQKVQAKFGASGTLKNQIAAGERAEVFASANMEHPRALASAKKSGSVVLFARNQLCALVRPGVAVTSATLLEQLLDPSMKLGTSTPRADPSGDYAWEVFRKAEAIKPGAGAALEKKALQLTGAPTSAPAPQGRALYGWHVAEGRADIFLTYCTNAMDARKQNPDQQVVALPDALAVGANYGLTVIDGAPPQAFAFAMYIVGGRPAHPGKSWLLGARIAIAGRNPMKISARNKLRGKIVDVKKGATTAHIRIDIGGQIVTAAITNESAEEFGLAAGQSAYAVIKASDVMVGID